jgi:uncharacterized Zn-finger protein
MKLIHSSAARVPGSAVTFSEAQLHCAKRVYMEVREAGQHSAMCPAAFAASSEKKNHAHVFLKLGSEHAPSWAGKSSHRRKPGPIARFILASPRRRP